jgi:hypothetical protein
VGVGVVGQGEGDEEGVSDGIAFVSPEKIILFTPSAVLFLL